MMRYLLVALMALSFVQFSLADQKAEVGKPAPQFTLTDSSGKEHSLAQYQGKIVVLEWINPQCPFVVRHYEQKTTAQLAADNEQKDVVWLAVSSTAKATPDEMNQWISQHKLAFPILMDNSGVVGKSYDAKTTPHMFIINREGTLVYSGALDDDPSGNKDNRTNYVAQALGELSRGDQVSKSETKPYGCSVKYAK